MVAQLRVSMMLAGEVRRDLIPQLLIHSLRVAAPGLLKRDDGQRLGAFSSLIVRADLHASHHDLGLITL